MKVFCTIGYYSEDCSSQVVVIEADSPKDAYDQLAACRKRLHDDTEAWGKYQREVFEPGKSAACDKYLPHNRAAYYDELQRLQREGPQEPHHWEYCNINLYGSNFSDYDFLTEEEFFERRPLRIKKS